MHKRDKDKVYILIRYSAILLERDNNNNNAILDMKKKFWEWLYR